MVIVKSDAVRAKSVQQVGAELAGDHEAATLEDGVTHYVREFLTRDDPYR